MATCHHYDPAAGDAPGLFVSLAGYCISHTGRPCQSWKHFSENSAVGATDFYLISNRVFPSSTYTSSR